MRAARLTIALAVLAGCLATTRRPSFLPMPEAQEAEVGFRLASRVATVERVTDTVASYLRAESLPVSRVEPFHGYLETSWFDVNSLAPVRGRPVGPDVVKVRAWIEPARDGFAYVEIETVYVPAVDPSVPSRDTEAPVADDHPISRRIAAIVSRLSKLYGVPGAQGSGQSPPVEKAGPSHP